MYYYTRFSFVMLLDMHVMEIEEEDSPGGSLNLWVIELELVGDRGGFTHSPSRHGICTLILQDG